MIKIHTDKRNEAIIKLNRYTAIIQFYKKLYRLLDEVTPLLVDCGELCQKACCDPKLGQGVYLFPGEEVMFSGKSYWEPIKIISERKIVDCDGNCKRDERPLFCRLFPLFPYLTPENDLLLVFYSPMHPICPLIKLNDFKILADDYIETVKKIGKILLKNDDCLKFMLEISREIDACNDEPWMKL